MDGLLAYDSTDSENEDMGANLPSFTRQKEDKIPDNSVKTDCYDGQKDDESLLQAGNTSYQSIAAQKRSKYSYSQFSSSQLPYNDHQRWIPTNLLPKANVNNINESISLATNLKEIGPHLPKQNENDYCEMKRPAVGPMKHKDVDKDLNNAFKPRPYIITCTSKKEREMLTCNQSGTSSGTALVGCVHRTSDKYIDKGMCGNSQKSTFQVRPYVSKREQERHTVNDSSATTVTLIGCANKHNDQHTDLNTDSTPTIVNKPPKRVLYHFNAHSKCVNHIRWNPSKQNVLASASMDHTIGIWDTQRNGLCLTRLMLHQAAVKDVKWTPCGTQLLSCGFDKCAKLIDVYTGKLIQNFPHKQYVTCVQFHPTDSNLFLAGTSRNGIYCWDVRQQKMASTFQAPFGQVQDIAFLPGGDEFISAAEVLRRNSTDKGIMAWDFRTTAIMSNQIYQEAFTCTCLKVHPSGSFFGAQSNANYIALFSTKRPYKLNKFKRYEGHKVSAYVIGFDFSPDGSLTVSGSADGNMYIYNSNTSHMISTIPAHSSVCMDVNYHPSLPSMVATCSFDGQIAVLVWHGRCSHHSAKDAT